MDTIAYEAVQEEAQEQEWETTLIQATIHPKEEDRQGPVGQEEHSPQEEAIQEAIQAAAAHQQAPRQQTGGAGCTGGTPPSTPPGIPHSGRHSDPWAPPLDRSRKALPKLSLPSNYKNCSILDTQQILKAWYDKSTFAIATWRGDAQKYWFTQVLDYARSRHDQWLQSTPSQRASLEPAYILGDRNRIPEAQNAVESVLRTELLDAIPKSIADACMRHGYCTAELIVWYVTKQLTLPPDINKVTTQREILTGTSSHA